MPVSTPFVTSLCRNQGNASWVHYVVTDAGHREATAVEVQHPGGVTTYKTSSTFLKKYGVLLRLGPMMEWSDRAQFKEWLGKIYFNSFTNFSLEGKTCNFPNKPK